jgi:hydrogenase nickel incorporation protein HypA/HybF
MHELSIALSMIERIEEETARRGGGKVEAVYVRVGVLSGVDTEALRFAYDLACEGTGLAGSRLEIEAVPFIVYCAQCSSTHTPRTSNIACPRCITPEQEILQGRELEVRAFEMIV